jgi:hypothetical protein
MTQDPKPKKKDSRSTLRKAFDTVERAVANRAEPMAQSGGFAKVLGVYVSVNKGTRGVLSKATGGVLHFVRIPTTGDVGKLHQHLASVDSHIAELIRDRERERLTLGPGEGSPGKETSGPTALEGDPGSEAAANGDPVKPVPSSDAPKPKPPAKPKGSTVRKPSGGS